MAGESSPTEAVREVRGARAWLAAIAESVDDAIIGKDLEGIVIFWNPAAKALFGYAAGEIIGQPITRIIPPDRIAEEATILERVRKGEKLSHFETRRRRKDGTVLPVALTIFPIRDKQERVIAICKVARDLSEAERTHHDLARSEALLRSILDTIPDALVVIDEHGLIRSFSTAAERLSPHAVCRGIITAAFQAPDFLSSRPSSRIRRRISSQAGVPPGRTEAASETERVTFGRTILSARSRPAATSSRAAPSARMAKASPSRARDLTTSSESTS